ncbi:MAG: small ribosomal subunit Rsm22 family protein, partial [Deltaproteobacteria bacterium]|nr:small ribosomal subunit Rsm22 family protein [Deltaproteobacteria bacterium]
DYVKTQSLLRLKSVLVDDGLTTIFPCPGDYPCPLLGTEDWCHVCFEVERGEFLTDCDRILGLNHHRIKYSILVFTTQVRNIPSEGRIIRIVQRKSRRYASVCFSGRIITAKVSKKASHYDLISIASHNSTL